MRINDIITEALLEMDSDIDRLYDKFFKKVIDEINEFNPDSFQLVDRIRDLYAKSNGYPLSKLIKDGIITNKKVIEANNKEPTILYIMTGYGNVYRPRVSSNYQSEIHIDFNDQAYSIVKSFYMGYDNIQGMADALFSGKQRSQFVNEFTPAKIKASINHEFAHFVDDILNNKHLSGKLSISPKFTQYSLANTPFDTYMEIEGQIHNIKQLKRTLTDKWDLMTFDDLFQYSQAIEPKKLTGKALDRWKKRIKKRMAREGLLGQSMR